MNDEQTPALRQAVENMRTMRESYNQLVSGVVTAPIVNELESGKAAIIAAINAMGGTATASMSMGELADAIRALILVQLGELEFDVPIRSVQEGANKLQDHCTKYVDDFTEIMDTPLIVDEWQVVEEVRYKKLLDYNFNQFSSDERKTGVHAITNCHNLRKLTFDALRTITLTDATSQFVYGNLIRLEEVTMPSLTSIINSSSVDAFNKTYILSDLSSLTSLSLPALTSISNDSGDRSNNNSQILSGLSSLTSLSLPALTSISSSAVNNNSQILSGLSSLTSLSLPAITNIMAGYRPNQGGSNRAKILSECINLEYIEIGHISADGGSIVDNMRLNIDPTNIYEDATKLAALNESIREHWFANLRDYTGGTAHTLTLMSAFVAHLEPETIQVATDKNWTIVTF